MSSVLSPISSLFRLRLDRAAYPAATRRSAGPSLKSKAAMPLTVHSDMDAGRLVHQEEYDGCPDRLNELSGE